MVAGGYGPPTRVLAAEGADATVQRDAFSASATTGAK